MKQWKLEFVRIFQRPPEGAAWDQWKKVRKKWGVASLTEQQIQNHRAIFDMQMKRLEQKKKELDDRRVKTKDSIVVTKGH